MRICIFDVENGSCAFSTCRDSGYSVMFDCAKHENHNPVDTILHDERGWFDQRFPIIDGNGVIMHHINELVISHPDDDHICNFNDVFQRLNPRILHSRKISEYPMEVLEEHLEKQNFQSLKNHQDSVYTEPVSREDHLEQANQAKLYSYFIPMDVLQKEEQFANSNIKNFSSIVSILDYQGIGVLFGGDMEEAGWKWLLENNWNNFREDLKCGIDVFVAPHHGHKSGYYSALFDHISPKLIVASKASESGISVVDPSYSKKAMGSLVYSFQTQKLKHLKFLTTRNNGNIYLELFKKGQSTILRAYVDRF